MLRIIQADANTDRFDGVYDRSTGAVLHRNSPHSGDTLQSKRHDARSG